MICAAIPIHKPSLLLPITLGAVHEMLEGQAHTVTVGPMDGKSTSNGSLYWCLWHLYDVMREGDELSPDCEDYFLLLDHDTPRLPKIGPRHLELADEGYLVGATHYTAKAWEVPEDEADVRVCFNPTYFVLGAAHTLKEILARYEISWLKDIPGTDGMGDLWLGVVAWAAGHPSIRAGDLHVAHVMQPDMVVYTPERTRTYMEQLRWVIDPARDRVWEEAIAQGGSIIDTQRKSARSNFAVLARRFGNDGQG